MALVNIPGVGLVNFPDSMSDAEIVKAIENDILPKYGPKKETPSAITAGGRGLARGLGELGITFGDLLPALAGKAVGAEKYAEEQLKEAEESRTKLEKKYPKAVESYKEVTPGTALPYVAERVGEAVGSFVPTIALGGVGGVAARALGAAATRGVMAGAGAGSLAQQAPEVFESVYRETGKMAPGTAVAFALPAAALDMIVPANVVTRFGRFGALKAAEKSLADAGKLEAAKLIGKEAAKAAAAEGLTESAQESITIAAEQFEGSNKKFFDPNNIERIIEAGISGAIAGAPLGAGTKYVERRRDIGAKEAKAAQTQREQVEAYQSQQALKVEEARAEKAAQPFVKMGEAAAAELDKVAETQERAAQKTAEEELAPTVSPFTTYVERAKQEAEAPAPQAVEPTAEVKAEAVAPEAASEAAPLPTTLDLETLKSQVPAAAKGPRLASLNSIANKVADKDLSDPVQRKEVLDIIDGKMQDLSGAKNVYRDQLEALSKRIEESYGPATDRAVQPEAGQPPSVAGVGAPVRPAEEPPVGRPEGVGAGGVGVAEGVATRDVGRPPAGEVAVEGFTTAKGSTYELTPEGKTVRTKRSPGEGQGTTYPPHDVLYVDSAVSAGILSDMQSGALTPKKYAVRLGYIKDNKFKHVTDTSTIPDGASPAVAVIDRNKNKIVSLHNAQRDPAVGLSPVEKLYQKDGTGSTHIGNKIISLKTKAPTPVAAAPAAPAVPPTQPAPVQAAFDQRVKELREQSKATPTAQPTETDSSEAKKSAKVLPSTAADAESRLFRRAFGDLDKETQDFIIGGDVKDALERLVKTTQSDTVRLIAQRLLAQPDFLPTIQLSATYFSKISHPERKRWVGVYQPDQHHVILKYPSGLNEHTFIHELMHAYVYRIIDSPNLTQTQRKAVQNLKEIYEAILLRNEATGDFTGEYGLTNIHEFISEAFSNPKFQQKLKQVKTSKVPTAPSLWTKFTRAVAALFGMDNALGRTMKEVDDLLTVTPTLPPYRFGQAAPLAHAPTVEPIAPEAEANLVSVAARQRKSTLYDEVEKATTNPNPYISEKSSALKIDYVDHVSGLAESLKNLPMYDWLGRFRGDAAIRQAARANELALFAYENGPLVFDRGALTGTYGGPSPGKARRNIIDKAKADGVDPEHRLALFSAFMWARRDVSLLADYEAKQRAAQAVLSNPAASASEKATAKQQLDEAPKRSHLTDDEVQQALKLGAKYPEFEEAAQVWTAFNQAMVKLYVQAGIISPDKAETWLNNIAYIPFHRVMDEEQAAPGFIPSLTGKTTGLPTFKKLKGSERRVDDAFDNMLRNTMFGASIAARNLATRISLDSLEALGQARRLKAGEKGGNVSVFENGERVFYQVDDPHIRAAFEGVDSNVPVLIEAMGMPVHILRKTVTLNPITQFWNIYKESLSAWQTVGYKGFPQIYQAYRDYFKALVKGPNEDQKEILRRGIANISYTGTEREREGAIRIATKNPSWAGKIITALEHNAALADASVRAQVYRKFKETGDDPALAAYKASQTIDYYARGRSNAISTLRHFVPFLPSQIQSLRMLYEAARGRGGLSVEDRARIQREFWVRGATIAAMSMAYTFLISDEPEYENLRDEVRDNYWFLPGAGPDGSMLRIPIQFEAGMLFKTIPERLTRLMLGADTTKEFKDSMVRIFSRMFIINPMPQGLLPWVEVTANYSLFRERPIVGQGLEDKEPYAQYSAYTSETAKALGALINQSPQKIDYLIQAYFTQMGAAVLFITDAMVGTAGENPAEKPAKEVWQMPFVSSFFANPMDSGKKQDFYELRKQVQAAVQTFNKFREESPERALAYREEKKNLLLIRPAINAIEQKLETLRTRDQYIRASTKMTADEKKEALREIRTQENQVLSRLKDLQTQAGLR